MPTDELKREIKQLVIDALQIPDVQPDQVDDSSPLFGNELLDLDSIDAVELVVALQRTYGTHIDDQTLARSVLHSVDTIAEFVEANRTIGGAVP